MFSPIVVPQSQADHPGRPQRNWAALDWLSENFNVLLHMVRRQQGSVANVLSAEMC